MQGLSHVHRAAVVAFFVLPQKIIPDAAPRREDVPRKTKIGFLHETEAEPTARQGPEHIGFSIQINHAIPHLIRRNN